MRNAYLFKEGRWQEIKGGDLEKVSSIIIEERITLREMKSKYPSQHKTLTKWLQKGTGK